MNEVTINIKESGRSDEYWFMIATKWDEVEPVIYPALAALYLAKADDYKKTVAALALLAREAWEAISKLDEEELFDLLPAVDWVFNKLDLSKNLQPVIRIGETDF